MKNNLTVLMLAAVLATVPACGTVGSKTTLSAANELEAGTSSAHNLSLRDANKSAQTNGVGPSVFSSVGVDGAETITSGTPIQNIVFTKDPGGKLTFAVSGGQDLTGESITIDPVSGVLSIGKVGSSASQPIEALGPATIEQIKATKEALIEQIKAAKEISESAKSLLISVVTSLAGV